MGNSFDERKSQLRAEMRAVRKAIAPEERMRIDAALCEKVCALPQFKDAAVLFGYLSFGAEVETRGIIERAWREGKEVVLPRCTGPREMRWFRVTDFEGLEKSSIGVEEPRIDEDLEVNPADCSSALALVPGLTFDEAGFRLGYGGGFYDAFLAQFPGVSAGLCRFVQKADDLTALGVIDVCDKPADLVVFA